MFSSLLRLTSQSVSRRSLSTVKLQVQKLSTSSIRCESDSSVKKSSESTPTTGIDEQYTMILRNSTDQPWHFAVYQKYPSSPGLTSIAWQVRGIPPKTSPNVPAASAQINWTMEYGVCIANFDSDNRKFTGVQYAPALLGNNYKVISLDNIPSVSATPTGTGNPDQIVLKNATSPPATKLTMGFTLSNNIVAIENDVGGMQRTIFRVHPSYYVACYRNITHGQLVDEGVSFGPIEVRYEEGAHLSIVEAFKDAAGNYQLRPVVPA